MYFKKEPRPPFSKEQFTLTLLLGLVVGLIQFYTVLPFDAIMSYLINLGIVAFLESLIKLAWNFYLRTQVMSLEKKETEETLA